MFGKHFKEMLSSISHNILKIIIFTALFTILTKHAIRLALPDVNRKHLAHSEFWGVSGADQN
jgi:hypothetical protein